MAYDAVKAPADVHTWPKVGGAVACPVCGQTGGAVKAVPGMWTWQHVYLDHVRCDECDRWLSARGIGGHRGRVHAKGLTVEDPLLRAYRTEAERCTRQVTRAERRVLDAIDHWQRALVAQDAATVRLAEIAAP